MQHSPTILLRSPLHAVSAQLGARLTGWSAPLRHGSETAGHRAVRERAGLFAGGRSGSVASGALSPADAERSTPPPFYRRPR
ncbi:hypothetical protein [Micromonospora echinofusca]|uniref:hypothetical protein n=1 Tax=Micromonospora echinofusca TaxID=47858 RepID=UPI00371C37D6